MSDKEQYISNVIGNNGFVEGTTDDRYISFKEAIELIDKSNLIDKPVIKFYTIDAHRRALEAKRNQEETTSILYGK